MDNKIKPDATKKLLNLVKNDCIKSIMKTEDETISFITDFDIQDINKSIETEKKRVATAEKHKDDDAIKAKKDEKLKPQIILKKGANFKKEAQVVKDTQGDRNNANQTVDANGNLRKDTSKEDIDKNTRDLLEIVRMMNEG